MQLRALGLPPDYVQALDAGCVSRVSGLPPTAPAWFYPAGGWVDPGGFAASLLARAGSAVEWRPRTTIAAIRQMNGAWELLDQSGHVIDAASVIVLANAHEAGQLLEGAGLPLQRIRGQTTTITLESPGLRLPCIPVVGNGYVLPALPAGIALFGATAQIDDEVALLRADDQRHNLMQLARLTGSAPSVADSPLAGRVGWRCVAPDRLPLIGGVADAAAMQVNATRLDQARLVPRVPGLFVFTALASRGLTWAALGARTLASQISGAPCPLESSLLDAVDTARFAARAVRRA